MKFIDEAIITIQSGNGGKGCVSFRREKFIPRGGPDGGDGGKGGDVVFKTISQKHTLYDFKYKKLLKAENGWHGEGNQKSGKKGEDLIVEIPPGTTMTDTDTGLIIKDLVEPDQSFTIAVGGRGGQGNKKFATSTHRTPRFAQPGEEGQTLKIKLELKLIADVGIIGLPNAGKSTLISVMSSAHPKIADYPFTTLTPVLGVVEVGKEDQFVMADIPGLIEGAHTGTGLGIKFLKHVERTRILIHLIDASSINTDSPLSGYDIINKELALYSKNLAEKPQLVVLNKIDITDAKESADIFIKAAKNTKVITISAATGNGIKKLKQNILLLLQKY
ncbi:Obg family GTPase [Desulfobacterium sp. N47]|uniref:GTPase Obg n=1 Tax=uncultured Desulfobacterium sp. TaxID=201089 RepID=E1YHF8_9BACT|nr:GTPase obgE [uncultured Desulfobacterium sp.]